MKQDGRKLDHRTLEEIRKRAVERVRKGEKPSKVIASYGFARSVIYRWLKAASGRGKGMRALLSRKGTGRPRKLTAAQERQVFRWIDGKNPMQYQLNAALWSRKIVGELIQREFGVSLSLASVSALLARLGLNSSKPRQRAYQRNPEVIERWQRESYPAIARQAREESGEILFWDESGFRADAVQGKTRGVKGETPVQEPGQQQSISAASAVSAQGAFWYATDKGALDDGELFVSLLKKLMNQRKKAVHLIVEGLPAHRGAVVKDYVASTEGKLTLHFLPGYAPDLNPDERV